MSAKDRTPLQIAAGKLISAVQKEWIEESGDPSGPIAEQVLNRAMEIGRACADGSIGRLLAAGSVAEYLDATWVEMHPAIKPYVREVTNALKQSTAE